MVTLVWLAVLALGVGLIAVFAAEQGHPATDRNKPRRHGTQDPSPAAPELVESPASTAWDPVPAAAGPPSPTTTAATTPALPRADAAAGTPAPYVAIEGAFGDIAIPSAARRIRSLATMATIVVVVGVGAAAVLGAGFLIVGELLNTAIG